MSDALLESEVRKALQEDWGPGGDITTDSTVPPDVMYDARITARQKGVISGLRCAFHAFHLTDAALVFSEEKKDGMLIEKGDVVARIKGPASGILKGERVALNYLTHLSGISTLTWKFVEAVKGTGAAIVCTRKTIPGLRALQKYAVRMGGGQNHRMTLDSAILIKDNHIAAAGGIIEAVKRAKAFKNYSGKIEVETDTLAQVEDALKAKADIIMLDNFSPADVKKAVALINGRASVEVSGGVNLETVRSYAEAGANIISIGALTHSAPTLDLGLDF